MTSTAKDNLELELLPALLLECWDHSHVLPHLDVFSFLIHFLMFRGVLHACIPVQRVNTESLGTPGTRVRDGCELLCGRWE